jgi:hypothetical protein
VVNCKECGNVTTAVREGVRTTYDRHAQWIPVRVNRLCVWQPSGAGVARHSASQSHAIMLSSPQPPAAEQAVIQSPRPSRALSDPGADSVLMGKPGELRNGV